MVSWYSAIIVLLYLSSVGFTTSYKFDYFPLNFPSELPLNPNDAISDQCRNDLRYWISSLEQFISFITLNCTKNDSKCQELKSQGIQKNLFAISQLDSFGRIPANLLGFSMRWQGSWDECINVESGSYKGGFCWLAVAPNLEGLRETVANSEAPVDNNKAMTDLCSSGALIQWSVCMPSSCTSADVLALFQPVENVTTGMLKICEADCHPAHTPKKKAWFWIVSGYCLFVGFLLIISSLIDYATETTDEHSYEKIRSTPAVKVLLAFSVYQNGAEILSVNKRPGQIHSLNCIRVVSMTWVVLGHAFSSYAAGDNPLTVLNARNYFLNQVLFNAYPSVDSFLFIGGVLLGYLFFKDIDRNRKNLISPVYWSLYYIHRYIRLSIPYLFFLGFYTIMFPYFIKGPIQLTDNDVQFCKDYWWRNLLYINNFFKISEMCMPHTWYLSTDMQIYCFSPILLISLCLSPVAGGVVTILLLILTIAATYGTYFKYDLPATTTGFIKGTTIDMTLMDPYMIWIYAAPWIRYVTNLFGILTGYVLYKLRGRKLRLHWSLVIALWLASIAIGIGCVYGLFDYDRGKSTFSTAESATYYTFYRIGWSLALAWVIIACQHNKGGFIKNFMEHSFWMPLARLTYCGYLIHFFIVYIFFSQYRTVFHFDTVPASYIHMGIPIFVLSYSCAFVWSCGFELPFGKLEKMAVTAVIGRPRRAEGEEHELPKQKIMNANNSEKSTDNAWQVENEKTVIDQHKHTNNISPNELSSSDVSEKL